MNYKNPTTYKEAISRRDGKQWIKAVDKEMDQMIEMDVVALNHGTFDTGLLHLIINVTQEDRHEMASRCVRLKIDNLNLPN